jgi:hypothetical protein
MASAARITDVLTVEQGIDLRKPTDNVFGSGWVVETAALRIRHRPLVAIPVARPQAR